MDTKPTNRQMALSIASVFEQGREYLLETQSAGDGIARQGAGMGIQDEAQTLTRADVLMQRWFGDAFRHLTCLGELRFEGEPCEILRPGGFFLFVDEVDGSQNRMVAPKQLSHCAVATLVDRVDDIRFGNVVAAVMANYLDGSIIYAHRNDKDGSYQTEVFSGLSVVPMAQRPKLLATGVNRLDFGDYPFIAEQYYAQVRELCTRMFAGRDGNLRSLGNSAWEGVLTAMGRTTGFISTQKSDEAGPMWALTLGAGGFASTLEGEPLNYMPLPLRSKGKTGLVLAPTEEVGRHIVELCQKFKASP